MKENPCRKDCPERSIACHGSCGRYREFRAYRDELSKDRAKKSMLRGYDADFHRKIEKRR